MSQIFRSILLTRPIKASKRIKGELLATNNQLDICISPLIEIQYPTYDFLQQEYSGYVFTSENAIHSLLSKGVNLGSVSVYCVGNQTRKLAINVGYNVIQTFNRVEEMVSGLEKSEFTDKLFYFRGEHVSQDLKLVLGNKGIEIEELIVYNQRKCPLAKEALTLLSEKPCLIPLYSARTARLFSNEVKEIPAKGHLIFCMSENIKQGITLDWETRVASDGFNPMVLAQHSQMNFHNGR